MHGSSTIPGILSVITAISDDPAKYERMHIAQRLGLAGGIVDSVMSVYRSIQCRLMDDPTAAWGKYFNEEPEPPPIWRESQEMARDFTRYDRSLLVEKLKEAGRVLERLRLSIEICEAEADRRGVPVATAAKAVTNLGGTRFPATALTITLPEDVEREL